ncbi:TonB-dependent receptor [Sessilibacter sp. MAH1]
MTYSSKSVIAYALILSSTSINAQTQISNEKPALETVVVVGQATQSLNTGLAGSVDIIGKDELNYEHVNDTLELFNKVPGAYLARYNQGIINTDVAIRGFAGDGSTPHAKLIIDGIPSNLHNGYGELDQLFPLAIDSLQVFKGTSDASYGLYNIAGNYEINTRNDAAKEIEISGGSYDAKELSGYFGFDSGLLKQSYSLGYRESDGYRDHTNLEKYSLTGQWAWQLLSNSEFKIIARKSSYDADAPGYLSQSVAESNPTRSEPYANQDGGEKDTEHLSFHFSSAISDTFNYNLKTYYQHFERERWVRFSESSSLQNRFDDQDQFGFRSEFEWFLTPQWLLTWGADYEQQDIIEQRFGTVGQTRTRDTANVLRNFDYTFENYGGFIKIQQDIGDTLRWNLALRADRLDGDFTNKNTAAQSDIYKFGTIIQPKFNVIYAITDDVDVFANLGRSFQHPFGSAAFTSGDRNARDVSYNDGAELGFQWNLSTYLQTRISYWQQKATDEFVLVDGIAQNVGETKRQGIDVSFNGELTQTLNYWSNIAFIDTEILKSSDSDTNFTGNELRSIPEYTASIGVNYQVNSKLITRIHVDAQGDYYVNEANIGGKFGGYETLNISADYQLNYANIKLQLNNLTDEDIEYVFDLGNSGVDTIHSPGNGVNANISIKFEL